jgi:phosphoserine aminotransferase
MTKIYNFSAGPAVLPQPVLQQAAQELVDWRGSGMSVMEMSHRGAEFIGIYEQAVADVRELMAIPKNYQVLFLQGGASAQFAMVPMNILRGKTRADYVNTGQWSKKAISDAKKYCQVNVAASSEAQQFNHIPAQAQWQLDDQAAYVHITTNETIGGVEFHWVPDTGDVPLVADMSSHILSRPMDVSRYGLIYAGAQKNIGPAGVTIVIVRDDLMGHALPITPTVFDFKVQADNDSMSNTPPTYGIYIAGLVFQWLKQLGGLSEMERLNRAKAAVLYDYLDQTEFYHSPVARADRSLMNIPFTLRSAELDAAFIKTTEAAGLMQLKGHRSVGGMRASIYNAMPIDGVLRLVEVMREFERKQA